MILFLAGVMIVPTVYVLMDGGTLKQEDNVRKDFLRHFREKKKNIEDMQNRAYDVLNEFDMRKVGEGGVKIIKILNEFGIKTYMDELKSPYPIFF